jgi:cysteine synthase
MTIDRRARTSLFQVYRPALIHFTQNLVAAAFPLMKIYPAWKCLETATSQGLVNSSTLIVESSSGTMALGLAIVCRWAGNKLVVVSDYACDSLIQTKLRDLGAVVEIVPAPAAVGGYQRARLDRLNEIRSRTKDCWWVNQYDNCGNAESYSDFAVQLIETLGRVDCLVGAVGSGGSVCGTARFLRTRFPNLRVIGVDTLRSVLFGQPDGPRELRGLGNSVHPKNLDHTAFDEVHWVTAAEAYTATRLLHQQTALFRGGTSGAAWLVAKHWADQHPGSNVVCLFPDDGYRYLDSIYNDRYMQENHFWLSSLPSRPCEVEDPRHAGPGWTFMKWGRRTLERVVAVHSTSETRALAAGI